MNTTESEAHDQTDMARLIGGDDAALNDLMQRHGERLFHYLIRLLQDEEEAEDIAQETFARVYRNRDKFRRGKKFSTWLYTIATNLARDRLRWLTRHRHVSLDAAHSQETSLSAAVPANELSPRETLEVEERAAMVRRAVANLPEELRVPLVLAQYEELPQAEIAEMLECSVKAVEMRIYRARQQLRASLAPALKPVA